MTITQGTQYLQTALFPAEIQGVPETRKRNNTGSHNDHQNIPDPSGRLFGSAHQFQGNPFQVGMICC